MNYINKGLYIVSTPIGNLEDITLRALNILKNSNIILCEDTRHTLKLLNHFKIKNKLIPYHKFNEKKQINKIIQYLNEGKILSLVSDAGTPVISDPGNLLIKSCIDHNISVFPIPGPSSVISAISVAGFDERFLFYGFLPKKENELNKELLKIQMEPFSLVFFIPSIKINFYLKVFKKYFLGRKILIAREITKLHETYYRGEVGKIKLFKTPIKGELTVVISKINSKKQVINIDKLREEININLKKYSVKDVAELISKKENISKKKVYNICLEIKNEKIK
jgi:16S rRNA (cytidine1402-2'-O)-methyltransferase